MTSIPKLSDEFYIPLPMYLMDSKLAIVGIVREFEFNSHSLDIKRLDIRYCSENVMIYNGIQLLFLLGVSYCVIDVSGHYYAVRKSRKNTRAYVYPIPRMCLKSIARLENKGEMDLNRFATITSHFLYLD